MTEWTIDVPASLAKELEDSLARGAIVDDYGRRLLEEEQVARINGLKIEIFSREHPPPHFRVSYQGESNDFAIRDCAPLGGKALCKYFRNIKEWHRKNKKTLIETWNKKRPGGCPVGEYRGE